MSLETYGRYQLLKKLATGGMAQIYLARQVGPEGFEKLLVVKRILPHLAENEEFITMFLDEARIAARLNHPNIVQIFDLGAQDDSYFIAMEFIHGEDVRRVWKHGDKVGQSIPLPLICRIVIEASAGLDYAHKKPDAAGRPLNIVHRDISPQNILVSFEGGVKVVDFGIAKAADQATVTRSGVLKGKYSYMSPEQAAGQSIDCRTDIFALGVVLYELLTGTRLFKRATDIQTLNAVTECEVAPPSEINDRVPPELDAIVLKALAKDRTARFSEARQLGAALEQWLLENALPSGAAALAGYMQAIYADRLAQEREEGRLLVETAESSRGGDQAPERATPSLSRLPRQTKSVRATPQAQASPKNEEITMAERPASRSQSHSRKVLERALANPPPSRPVPKVAAVEATHTAGSMPTQNEAPNRRALVAVGAVVLVASLGLGAWVLTGSPAGAKLTIDSKPQGASVLRDGQLICQTPCALAALTPGDFVVSVALDGYLPVRRSTTLHEGASEDLGVVMLELETKLPPQLVPPAVKNVVVRIDSDPSGAELTLDGAIVGVTPFSRTVPAGTVVELRLEVAGHVSVTDRFTVPEATDDPHRYTLKPTPKAGVRPPEVRTTPSNAKGTARFVVKPWAVVDCPLAHLKDTTPFGDQQLPAGDYTCTFTHPDFPPQKKTFRVEANSMVKVQVNFLQ